MEKCPTDYADAMFLLQSEIDAGECIGNEAAGVSDADAAIFWARYAALHAVVPERILKTPTGSRADIHFGAVWAKGLWTVEISRKLNTGNDDDIQFYKNKEYPFGVAIFDNSRHGYQHKTSEMYYLKFNFF